MPVPVENIYYLLCYAWDRLDSLDKVPRGSVPGNRVENLLGQVLGQELRRLLARNLERQYSAEEQDTPRLRGKPLLGQTLSRSLRARGEIACLIDELVVDTLLNRVVKTTLRRLIAVHALDPAIRATLRERLAHFDEVGYVELVPSVFRRIQLHASNRRYGLTLNLCRLAAMGRLPHERGRESRFVPFTENQQQMGLLFQAFVKGFYQREQFELSVSVPKVAWDVDESLSSGLEWLPEMHTDVVLSHSDARLVIETKYYATPYQSRSTDSRSVISEHLYQLLTYLNQMSADGGPKPVGMLLYADTKELPSLDYRVSGYDIGVRSLNLDQEWAGIHRRLLEFPVVVGVDHPAGRAELS